MTSIVLTSSADTVTEEGSIKLTVASSSVTLLRDGQPLSETPSPALYTLDVPITYADNGVHTITATELDGDIASVQIAVNIQPRDTFAGMTSGQSLASALWDTKDRSWDAKTWMSSDGNGATKIDLAQYSTFANYLSHAGDVGHAVIFKTTGARSASGILLSIAMDCAGSTATNTALEGVEAQLNGANYLYAKGPGGVTGKNYSIDVGSEYCLETCHYSGKTYNARLSKYDNGKRGAVIAAGQVVLTTARATTDVMVQLRTSTANKDILRILRVEALTTPFEVTADTTTTTTTGTTTTTTTTAPKVAPTFLYPENETAIAGPTGIVVQCGQHGAPVTLEAVELLYSGMSIGFAGNTQSRWRMRPVTVSGIQFVPYVGLDSNGRVDVWIGAMFGTGTGWTAINRERAALDLRISRNGTAFSLYGDGDTYSYNHQRGAWIRYESEPLPWNLTHDFIAAKQASGAIALHDTRNMTAVTENCNLVDEKPYYRPFGRFSDTVGSNNAPYYDTRYLIGTQYRSTSAGGERLDLGPVHEWFARLISEVGTNNNTSWLTAAKATTLRYVAEAAAQTPLAAGMLDPSTGRLLDPAATAMSCHRNAGAWAPCSGIPQPGRTGYEKNDNAEMEYDSYWDTAHRPNVGVSYHAHQLSNDPWHLFLTQASAVACLAYGTGNARGSDGKIPRATVEEERGFWWTLLSMVEAWKATPDGDMPKPFMSKADIAKWIDATLQWIRDSLMTDNAAYSSPMWQAAKYWRIVYPFTMDGYSGDVFASPFMCDYGNWAMLRMLGCGYTKGRDVAEWKFEGARLRAQAGGSLYGGDKDTGAKGYIAQWIGFTTGTLPYSDAATFKAAHPRRSTALIEVDLSVMQWQYGRDMNMFHGVLNYIARTKAAGLATINWDPKAEALALVARHPGPYTYNGVSVGWWAYGKQYVTPLP